MGESRCGNIDGTSRHALELRCHWVTVDSQPNKQIKRDVHAQSKLRERGKVPNIQH